MLMRCQYDVNEMLMRDLGLEFFHLFAEILRHSAITENSDGTIDTIVRQQLSNHLLIAFI